MTKELYDARKGFRIPHYRIQQNFLSCYQGNKLVIMQSHKNVKHNGVRETLTEIQVQSWIIKGRQTVKDVLCKCVTCQKMLGRAFSTPPTPPLPSFRVSDELAFSKVGVDFAGSLFVKNIYQSKREVEKCYIAL